ncbi:MAG: tyrosine-type recombinase/integrase [Polyangiaceae bacterium]
MGRRSTGTVRVMPNAEGVLQWHARFTRADGKRSKWMPLDPRIPADDEPRARACAAQLAVRVKAASPETGIETVAAYAERWLADREGRIVGVRRDRSRLRDHVLPTLGALDVRTFGRDDVERVRDALDEKISEGALAWGSAANIWHLVTSMCRDMTAAKRRELRVRDDNPALNVKSPETGSSKAKQFLYPSEFLRFVECEAVPLRMRRAVALAVYTFTRDGELRALRWGAGDVDLDHGVLSITRALNRDTGRVESTKSGEGRRFAIEANLLPLLRAMHDEASGTGPVADLPPPTHAPAYLRRFLLKAGVDRPELHKGSPTRKPMTWHDLRATGLTWMAVRGDDPLKIKQRAGHAAFSTTEIYIRSAEAVRQGFGEPFPELPACLLGSGADAPPSGNSVIESSLTENGSRNGLKQALPAMAFVSVETKRGRWRARGAYFP